MFQIKSQGGEADLSHPDDGCLPALDLKAPKRGAAWTGIRVEAQAVTQIIADERLGMIGEYR